MQRMTISGDYREYCICSMSLFNENSIDRFYCSLVGTDLEITTPSVQTS